MQRNILGDRGYKAWKAGAWPSSQWARRRTTDEWRDSYTPARPPEKWAEKPKQQPKPKNLPQGFPAKPPEGLTSKEAGWPTGKFIPVSERAWRHIARKHGEELGPSLEQVVALMQQAATSPGLIANHPRWENVIIHYKESGGKLYVLGC